MKRWNVHLTAGAIMTLAAFGAGAQQQASAAPNSYARYVTPGWCVAAAGRTDSLFWRDRRPDTVVYAPLTDSVPTPVRDVARTCAARFTVAATPVSELLSLVQLSLWAGLDTQARAAADRLIAAQSKETLTQRGWIVSLVAQSFLDAQPTRLTDAKRYLAQLDAIGAPAGQWRAITHLQLAALLTGLGDVPGAATEYRVAIGGADQMSQADRMNHLDFLLDLYRSAAEIVGAAHGGPAALRFVDSAQRTLAELRPPGSPEASMIETWAQGLVGLYRLYGTRGPRLTASHWYTTDGDTIRPRPGVVSLIVFGNPNFGGLHYPQYATIRRLEAKYGSALQTTILTGTVGFYRNHAMPSPAAESDSTGHYFLDFLKLPVGVAASDVAFSFRDDGRRVNQATENIRNYERGLSTIVVGADGVIRLAVELDPTREKLVDQVIAASRK